MLHLKQEYKNVNKVINKAKVIADPKQVENNRSKPRNLRKVINQKLGKGNRKYSNIDPPYDEKTTQNNRKYGHCK